MTVASRIRNYYYARAKRGTGDDLPWLRIGGLDRFAFTRPVVLINGAFDLLTAAHMRLISVARDKAEGGTLVCALDSDAKIRGSKGPGRPILSFVERATALGYMPIDYLVEIDTDEDMHRLVGALAPDLRVQGAEYARHNTRFPNIRRCFVSDTGVHASDIIERIKHLNDT